MKRKGTDNIAVEKVSMREIMTDHYDQSDPILIAFR